VARAILLTAGMLWLLLAAAGVGLALLGVDRLLDLLPPLAIDAEAVSRTLAALAIAAALLGVAHLVIAGGVRRDRSWAFSAGILLAAGAAVAFLALAAAAVTSGVAGTMSTIGAVGASVGAALAAMAYATAGAALVDRLRTGGPI
jgi:hypothetical protein